MKKLLTILLAITTINISNLKSQNLDNFELRAHYALSSDGVDLTGNNDPIILDTPIFEDGGIFSRGCYVFSSNFGDSCLIETPLIDALNDNSFAVQIDFKLSAYNKPIFIMGHSSRYLGLETYSNNTLFIRMNNSEKIFLEQVDIALDQWYNATFIHTKGDSLTQLFIDGMRIHNVKEKLNLDSDDTNISNSSFSTGNAFHGHLKNLKVYSSDILISTENLPALTVGLSVWPNPTSDQLNIDGVISEYSNYVITDIAGKKIAESDLTGPSINVEELRSGLYVLSLYDDLGAVHSVKFVKR